jgi:hypothetical protein
VFPADSQGLFGMNKPDNFFGVVDLTNPSNPGGTGTAQWTFDVSGFTHLALEVDVGAMGDFEASDRYSFKVQIDGGSVQTVLDFQADEAASHQYRAMDSGIQTTLADPLVEQGSGQVLDKTDPTTGDLDGFVGSISGTGSVLTLIFDAAGDGGSEAFGFDNIAILGVPLAEAEVVGFDDLDGGTNRLSLSVVPDEVATGFPAGDMFGIRSRSSIVNGFGLPFAISDDSVAAAAGNGVFPADSQGLFGMNKPDNFFGVVDLTNPSNPGGTGTAQWTFDVSGFTHLLLEVDVGAMGDFEASDRYSFKVQIDGGPVQTVLDFQADEAASHQYRAMDSGIQTTLADPLVEQGSGQVLDKTDPTTGDLDGFVGSISGTGSVLTLIFDAAGDGGSEAFGFDNIAILGVPPNSPPDCTAATAAPEEVWPPKHKFADVAITGVTDPDGDPVTLGITGIAQDEPVEGLGDGNTCPDGLGVGTDVASVRAERSGTKKVPGDGRVYHISFTAEDGQGGECSGTVSVCVPHDQGRGSTCVDGGPLFDSTVCGE